MNKKLFCQTLQDLESPVKVEWGMSNQKNNYPRYSCGNTLKNLSQNIKRFQYTINEHKKIRNLAPPIDKNTHHRINYLENLNKENIIPQIRTSINKNQSLKPNRSKMIFRQRKFLKSVELQIKIDRDIKDKPIKNHFLHIMKAKFLKNKTELSDSRNKHQSSQTQTQKLLKVSNLNPDDIQQSKLYKIFDLKFPKQTVRIKKLRCDKIRKDFRMTVMEDNNSNWQSIR